MFKILLVDDEINVVEGLKASIEWEKYGYNIPDTASNGIEGLEKALAQKPDVIITDITMPVMDGIEMARRIRENNPDVKLIFLTCHEDFNFVRDVLKLNAEEYLIKATMTRDDLYALLEKTAKNIEAGKKAKEKGMELSWEIKKNRYLVGESIIDDLINGSIKNSASIEKRLNIYGYNLNRNSYVLSLLKLDKYVELVEDNIYDDLNLVRFAILNITEEVLKKYDAGEVFANGKNEFVLIYNQNHDIKTSFIEKIRMISAELQTNIRKVLQTSCTIYIGKQYSELLDTSKAYAELTLLKNLKFYMNDEAIIGQESSSNEYSNENEYLKELANLFEKALQEFDIEGITTGIDLFIKRCCDFRYDTNEVKNTIEKMFLVLINFVGRSGYGEQDLFPIHYSEIIKYTDNIFTFRDILTKLTKKVLTIMAKNAPFYSNNEIKKIVQYVNQHLEQDIKLADVASHVNMNTSYFSRYFKNNTGEKFVDYVSRTRIEKAKKLLIETEMTIDEIAEKVGHVNSAYFNKVFKKLAKTTPGEYRNLYRKKLRAVNSKE